MHWDKVTDGDRGVSLGAVCQVIKKLPKGQLWRHNQAGDLPGKGNRVNYSELRQIVEANRGKKGFTYTHKPTNKHNLRVIREANEQGFTINISANSLEHADRLSKHRLPIAAILPQAFKRGDKTPAGRRVVHCPAQTRDDVTCKSCELCQKKDRKFVIGFSAHGSKAKDVHEIAANWKG